MPRPPSGSGTDRFTVKGKFLEKRKRRHLGAGRSIVRHQISVLPGLLSGRTGRIREDARQLLSGQQRQQRARIYGPLGLPSLGIRRIFREHVQILLRRSEPRQLRNRERGGHDSECQKRRGASEPTHHHSGMQTDARPGLLPAHLMVGRRALHRLERKEQRRGGIHIAHSHLADIRLPDGRLRRNHSRIARQSQNPGTLQQAGGHSPARQDQPVLGLVEPLRMA